MDKLVLVCENDIENILTGIYRAFEYCKQGYLPEDLDILVAGRDGYSMELFVKYETVTTDFDKATKTICHIRTKLGEYVYTDVLRVLCHYDNDRGYALFRFLYSCFKNGTSAADNLTDKYVIRVMELSRKSKNEVHLFLGFTRFKSCNGILYAAIEPKCNVIPLMLEHFSDRFYIENWIIEDKTHGLYAIHKAYGETRLFTGDFNINNTGITALTTADEYEGLWNTFFNSIAIKERNNPKCQQALLPLWFRENMIEFRN